MKRIIALILILTLALSFAACGGGNDSPATGKQTGTASDVAGSGEQTESDTGNDAPESAPNGNVVEIGGKTVELRYESRHGDMFFKENVVDIEKSSYGQACNLYCNSDDGMLFVIHIVYFEGKSVDEVMSGSENNLTDKTVGGLEYRYFEYDENGTPGHTYVYNFEGTTYTISFVSTFDMASLESVFLSNVRFEKE